MGKGLSPESFDKEYVRQWLGEQGYKGDGPPPALPIEVRCEASRRYIEAYELISGKPFFSIPASIPVAFELTILLSAFASFGGMLALNGLPRFYRPHFRSDRFRRATADRFFISIEGRDRQFDIGANSKLLRELGANAVEVIEE
jgi:hypothetical protein